MDILHDLEFTVMLLGKLHISSHIVDDPEHYISDEIDCGLRTARYAVWRKQLCQAARQFSDGGKGKYDLPIF